MEIRVEKSAASCGALVRGVDLSKPLSEEVIGCIRQIWLDNKVIAFPDQELSIEDLERFSLYMGPRSEDPFIAPMPGHQHVIEIRREADEKAPIFAESWHSDWSFLPIPPAGTVLYGIEIPPVGGNTLYADQCAAYDALSTSMKARLEGLNAIHSARNGYSPKGQYGEKDEGRSMKIITSESALATREHPLVATHNETGRKSLFISPAYTIGIAGLPKDEARDLLKELFAHQVAEPFVYSHRWEKGMLTIWDNRSVLHAATGGYEGHRRLLRRITVADRVAMKKAAEAVAA
ncbi:MAG: TauD/TfdA family dioxygenase [Burkholderiaceae bacterium]